jgi:hypothetical protein
LAAELEVSIRTVLKWKKDYPEIRDLINGKSGARLADKHWLPKFQKLLVGIAGVFQLSTAQAMPVRGIGVVSVQRQGQEVIATTPQLGEVRVDISNRALTASRAQTAPQVSPSKMQELRTAVALTDKEMRTGFDRIAVLSNKPVIINFDLDILPLDYFDEYFRELVLEARSIRNDSAMKNVFVYFSGDDARKARADRLLAELRPGDMFLGNEIPGRLANAERVDLTEVAENKIPTPPDDPGALAERVYIPVSPIRVKEGQVRTADVPLFKSMLVLGAYAGRVSRSAGNLDPGFRDGFERLSRSTMGNQTLSYLMNRRISDLEKLKEYSVKPEDILVTIEELLQSYRLGARMAEQSA